MKADQKSLCIDCNLILEDVWQQLLLNFLLSDDIPPFPSLALGMGSPALRNALRNCENLSSKFCSLCLSLLTYPEISHLGNFLKKADCA